MVDGIRTRVSTVTTCPLNRSGTTTVGKEGLEPPISCFQNTRDTKLRYFPFRFLFP